MSLEEELKGSHWLWDWIANFLEAKIHVQEMFTEALTKYNAIIQHVSKNRGQMCQAQSRMLQF